MVMSLWPHFFGPPCIVVLFIKPDGVGWYVWQKTGEKVTENQLHEILSEVDVNKNAEVDIDEFLLVCPMSL